MRKALFLFLIMWGFGAVAQTPVPGQKAKRRLHREARKILELGHRFFLHREWQQAIDCGHRVLALDSGNLQGYYLLSNAYGAQRDYVRSLNVMKLGERRFPTDDYVLLRIAQLWVTLQNSSESLKYYDRLIAQSPYSQMAYIGKSVVLYELDRKEESLEVLNSGMYLSYFNSPYAYWIKGVLLYERGDFKEALTIFENLQQTHIADHRVNFYLGMCHYEAHHRKLARKYLLRAKKKGMDIDEDVLKALAMI